MKIKMIAHSEMIAFQNMVNQWLAQNPEVEVQNIEYSVVAKPTGNMIFSAAIIYDEII